MAISTCNIWSNPLWSNNLGNDLSKSTTTSQFAWYLTSTLFPRFQSYYSHLQKMEYIAIAPCIKLRMYPSFALDETFPKALLLLTWLIPKCPTAEVQVQSNVLHFQDEFILISPPLIKLIHCHKPRFSLPNSSSLVLLCLSSNIIKAPLFH